MPAYLPLLQFLPFTSMTYQKHVSVAFETFGASLLLGIILAWSEVFIGTPTGES
jgi:hypothetical protein